MCARCVVKTRLAAHLEVNLPPDHRHRPNNLIRLLRICRDRHIVSQLGHTFFRKESREQNVRVRQVKLAYPRVRQLRLNLKISAPFIVE